MKKALLLVRVMLLALATLAGAEANAIGTPVRIAEGNSTGPYNPAGPGSGFARPGPVTEF